MRYIVGIDGGGSKTFALVAETGGRLLGFGRGGPSNYQTIGLTAAMASVAGAAREALQRAGLRPEEVSMVSCGLGGADLPEDFDLLHPALAELGLGARVELRNDSLIALRAGTSRSWGVVLVCGSGFNAAGRAPDGREIRLPALGWISGDWGGGSALAEEMVRLVMRADDGRGAPTLLTSLLLDALGQPTPYELMRALYHDQIEWPRLLGTVPLLFEAAERGDAPSQALIARMGDELAISAATIIRRLALERAPVEVVLAGSVFKGQGTRLTDRLREALRRSAPHAVLVRPPFEPVVGAVLLAMEALGEAVGPAVYERLHATMPEALHAVAPA